MAIWRNFSLRTKINLILLLILATFLAISLSWQYRQQRTLLFAEAVDKATIITVEATRTRGYISQQLLAGQIELNKDRYGMIPVVVANRVGKIVGEELHYTIRHVSNRYRNQANTPDDYERQALQRLEADPALHRVAELTTLAGAPVFRFLQAAYIEESCLECHGDPRQSPSFLKEIYPAERDPSYHYKLGDVIGAVSVVIPMSQLEKQTAVAFRGTLLTTSGFFIALVVCLGMLMQKAVIDPLRALASTIDHIRKTGGFNERMAVRSQDEIGVLVTGFNAMVGELGDKTRQLEESERRFRLLTEMARDAIVAFLPNGQIFLFNRQAEKMFGYSQAELLGESFDRLFAPERDLYGSGLTAFVASAPGGWFEEVHLLTGLRRGHIPVRLEMELRIIDSGDRPFYTAVLREPPPGA